MAALRSVRDYNFASLVRLHGCRTIRGHVVIRSNLIGHYSVGPVYYIGSLNTRVFETRTATGRELFSLLTCLHTTIFTLLSIFSPLEMVNIKVWETPLSWHAKCFLSVAVRASKTRVLKRPNF